MHSWSKAAKRRYRAKNGNSVAVMLLRLMMYCHLLCFYHRSSSRRATIRRKHELPTLITAKRCFRRVTIVRISALLLLVLRLGVNLTSWFIGAAIGIQLPRFCRISRRIALKCDITLSEKLIISKLKHRLEKQVTRGAIIAQWSILVSSKDQQTFRWRYRVKAMI